ncbi:tetratricopeptide repeat protein [Halospeciosus flavus]|uniref:Tetratricopeptide repeat protein n=1 Tax=Halospeciosus flavus TaxID=3032283 RepID=A0ABD5Z7E2_9EURY
MSDDGKPPEKHHFSEGQGFDDPYEGFDLDPPELAVDPETVDPVDTRVLADTLDERNVASDDVDADELIDVGLSYIGVNRHEQAVDAFERAARFADDDRTRQEAWVNKGIAHAELEEWDEAASAQQEALFVDEDGEFAAQAETNLAYALWEYGKTTEAYEHAEQAVKKDKHVPQAWYNLGFMENEQGRHEEAVDCFDNAIRLGFRQADVFEEKARALDQLGREQEAQEVEQHAEEIRQQQEERLVEQGSPSHGQGGQQPQQGGRGQQPGQPRGGQQPRQGQQPPQGQRQGQQAPRGQPARQDSDLQDILDDIDVEHESE